MASRRFAYVVTLALAIVASACESGNPAPKASVPTEGAITATPSVAVESSGIPTVSVPYSVTPEYAEVTVYIVYTGGCGSGLEHGPGIFSIRFDQVPVFQGTAVLMRGNNPWDCLRAPIPTREHPMFLDKKVFP
jgi:hypothetical protein